ncbi:MAG: hypothetical protein AAF372_01445, partial [Pseudomonadota bacterium]
GSGVRISPGAPNYNSPYMGLLYFDVSGAKMRTRVRLNCLEQFSTSSAASRPERQNTGMYFVISPGAPKYKSPTCSGFDIFKSDGKNRKANLVD